MSLGQDLRSPNASGHDLRSPNVLTGWFLWRSGCICVHQVHRIHAIYTRAMLARHGVSKILVCNDDGDCHQNGIYYADMQHSTARLSKAGQEPPIC